MSVRARKANHQLIEILSKINNPKLVDAPGRGASQDYTCWSLANRLRLENRVLMPGFISEEQKYKYLQAADAFASTTSHGGFGLMYVEGMFCRLPIVTYDHGGQGDFLRTARPDIFSP
jgi:glycosyltransferase involved in cell wall biosynthesis